MSSEILSAGYQDIRDYIEDNWVHIAICEGTSEILRRSVSHGTVSWAHDPGDQVLILSIVISGSDPEFEDQSPGDLLPQTLDRSRIHKTDSDTDPKADRSFTAFTLETVDDELTVRHRIQVPQI